VLLLSGRMVLAQANANEPADAVAPAEGSPGPAEGFPAPVEGQNAGPVAPELPTSTRATFLSTSAEAWDVTVDGVPACATPCTLPLSAIQFVTLRSQEPDPVLLDVGRLPGGDLVVSGKPLQGGMYAGGIVATALGGVALATGITLTAVGLAKGRDGMTTAGLISGGVGAVSVAGGIYLMLEAVPTVSIDRASPNMAASGIGMAGRW